MSGSPGPLGTSTNGQGLTQHLPPMTTQNPSSTFNNIVSLSPSRIEDKSKSATNKAYMIRESSQSQEESKRFLTSQYIKAFQKVH